MPQSTVIAATLIAVFILFLAARNSLVKYAAVLWGNTEAPLPGVSGAPPGFLNTPDWLQKAFPFSLFGNTSAGAGAASDSGATSDVLDAATVLSA